MPIGIFPCFVTESYFFWYLFVTQNTNCFSFFYPGKIIVTIGDYLILNITKQHKTPLKVGEITRDI
jgi:hypothetical protein